ncbi:MAG: DNA repair protein RecN [Chitinophagaceae bacterium]
MLQQLHIQNYAIIDEITIKFSPLLSIITGETGAGKSILVGALNLILGERADTGVLLSREKKCFVEGTFSVSDNKEVKRFIAKNDLDMDNELVIRREITANGKSRAFINDTPVTLALLQEVGAYLVDLHQQFDTLEVGQEDFQRKVLDALAGNNKLMSEYQVLYRNLQSANKKLQTLKLQKKQFNESFDYTKFLFEELQQAGLAEDELENAEVELKLLNNSEGIKSALTRVSVDLNEGEQPLVPQLKVIIGQLQPFTEMMPELKIAAARLLSAQIELLDISEDIERLNDSVNYDASKIEDINQRLTLGYKLFKKHGVKTTADLLKIQQDLDEKLQAVQNVDDTILEQEKEVEKDFQLASVIAAKISLNRRGQSGPLQTNVETLLARVGMPNARLRVAVSSPAEVSISGLELYGYDSVEFLFDANNNKQFAPIRKVASGGELSRLMLCIKSLIAGSVDLPTMIFDEIDTGISGEAARQVGFIMKDLASKRQIICITHQPQIAGKGDAHYYVYKELAGDVVKTNIRLLNKQERVTSIAQMLSGEKPTSAAIEHAREIIGG